MTYILMILFVVLYAVIVLAGVQYQSGKEEFFGLHDSTALKGMFCIIVVLVHVPITYQNRVQDMMGSFAYIGVTFFFMTSAYGLKYGTLYKEKYLHGFWRKRLPALLIPMFLCNLISVGMSAVIGNDISLLSFIKISDWVKVLLLFYFVFWMVYYISDKCNNRGGIGKISLFVW